MKKLVVFEFAEEIEDFIRQKSLEDLREKNTTILAVQPCAQAFLKRRNIPYLNTTGFIDTESHQRILLKSAEILEPLKEIFNLKDEIGVREGYRDAFLVCLRHYSVLYILWLIEIVNNAIEKIKPAAVAAVKYKYTPDRIDKMPQNERLMGIIVSKFAEGRGIKCDLYNAGNGADRIRMGIKPIAAAILEIIKLLAFHLNIFMLQYRSRGKKLILYSSDSYNLKEIIESFRNAFNNVMSVVLFERPTLENIKRIFTNRKYWSMFSLLPNLKCGNNAEFSESLISIVNQAKDILKNKKLLYYCGVDFGELVSLKLTERMIPFLKELHARTGRLSNLMKRVKPSLIVSQMSRNIFYNMAEIASISDIPSLMISHGSHVPSSNKFENMEWSEHGSGLMNTPYKYLAVQSPWALEYLNERPAHSALLITGPLLFTKVKNGKNKREELRRKILPGCYNSKIILHAGTPKPFQSSRPYVYETIDEYIENINSMISVIEQIENVHLIVRFRPSAYLKTNDFIDLLNKSDCYSVHTEGSFADYLSISDILVSYSSTAIEEALQNRIPVLIYDPQGRYCHIKDAQVLAPSSSPEIYSCYYADSEKNLSWAIRWLLGNHLSKEVPDSIWGKHVFTEEKIVDLTSYFKELFYK